MSHEKKNAGSLTQISSGKEGSNHLKKNRPSHHGMKEYISV